MPSSVIYGMHYQPHRETLDIVFRHGRGSYRYFGVPAAVWRAFVRAPSKGTFLNTVFKEKNYRYEKFEEAIPVSLPVQTLSAVDETSSVRSSKAAPRDLPVDNVWGFYD